MTAALRSLIPALAAAILPALPAASQSAPSHYLVPDPAFALAAALECLAGGDRACAERALQDLPPDTDPRDPVLALVRERIARAARAQASAQRPERDGGAEQGASNGYQPAPEPLSPSGYAPDDPRLLRLVRIDRIDLAQKRNVLRDRPPALPTLAQAAEEQQRQPEAWAESGVDGPPAAKSIAATGKPPEPTSAPAELPPPESSKPASGPAAGRALAAKSPPPPPLRVSPPPEQAPAPAPELQPLPRPERPGPQAPATPTPLIPAPPPAPIAAPPAARPMIALELKDGTRVVLKDLFFRAAGSDGSLQAPLPGAAFSTSRGIIVLKWESMAELRISADPAGKSPGIGPLADIILASGETIRLGLINGIVTGPRPNPPGGEFAATVSELAAIRLPR